MMLRGGQLVAAGARALGRTWRVEVRGEAIEREARRASPTGAVIYALWHGDLAVLATVHRGRALDVLVSRHRDGNRLAGVLRSLGYGLVRGSSGDDGVGAFHALARRLAAGRDVAVGVDGPAGPRHVVHRGVGLLAARTGCPIVAVVAAASAAVQFPSWDAMQLPWPGSRVRVEHAGWLVVPARRSRIAAAQALCCRLQWRLRRARQRTARRFGKRVELMDIQDRRSYFERASERARPPAWLRGLARAHGVLRRLDRRFFPRPGGRAGRPWVIGVGNLEAGGTGKTPIVCELAQALHARGIRCAVLTRGHGGRLGARGLVEARGPALEAAADETRLLVQRLPPDVPVYVSANKRRALEALRRRGQVEVLLVDDAFQTRGLAVDRHLVLLDGTAPLGNAWLLPAGRLRESPAALRHADAILFTRWQGGPPPRRPEWGALHPHACFVARERVGPLRRLDGRRVDAAKLRGTHVALLSGIGRPRPFEAAMRGLGRRYGFRVGRIVRVGDHAPIEVPLAKLLERRATLDLAYVVITAKDAARLRHRARSDEPLLVLEQRLVVDDLQRCLDVLLGDQRVSSEKSAKLTESEA